MFSEEILKGREIRSPEVPVIEGAISEGWIKVATVKFQPRLPDNLGGGEKEAIALMEQLKVDWLLLDDGVALTMARLRGLRVRSTAYLLTYWRRKGKLSPAQAIKLLDDLVKSGYYLSSKDYISIKELVTSL